MSAMPPDASLFPPSTKERIEMENLGGKPLIVNLVVYTLKDLKWTFFSLKIIEGLTVSDAFASETIRN